MSDAAQLPDYSRAVPTFGDRVRALRESKGLSIVEVGERASVSPNFWGEIERGYRPNPTLRIMATMARALDVEVIDLLDGVDTFPGD